MKVAATQMDITIFETEKNLEKILGHLETAARAGAGLAVFPECALSGYCYTSKAEAWPVTETVPGPSTERIAAAAHKLNISAVVGLLERDGDVIYNSAAVISPRGILGTHRKVHLLCLGIDRYDLPGDKPFPVFEIPDGPNTAKIGINICYDCSFPESGRVLKLKGAQLLAIPTNWPIGSDSWQHTPKVRAIENHMVVVAADRVGEERGFRFSGHSQIINLGGQVLGEAGETEETILYGEVDLAAANDNRVVRVPGEWEFDRMAARRPEMYTEITKQKAVGTKQ
ncbi:MAG TPA: carbon-nitrogen hydrolase family protein [Terriglobia bacterium]|nr:carbon-nitrogen hydrolase family protein [Terriglobia bacterium]